jgi:hypothetical protein
MLYEIAIPGCPDHRPGEPGKTCSLQRFSAVCWYFGKSLSDGMAMTETTVTKLAGAERTNGAGGAAAPTAVPVPIGLIHSSIGGTTIQQWMPPGTTTNATCAGRDKTVASATIKSR